MEAILKSHPVATLKKEDMKKTFQRVLKQTKNEPKSKRSKY